MKKIGVELMHEEVYEGPMCSILEVYSRQVLCSSLTGANAEGISEVDYFESIW